MMIGYDRRFLSKQAAEAAAEVFAGNNIPTILLSEDAPTPLITYATALEGSAYGLVFTASHNPPEWNGLKVFRSDGSLLLDDETRQIEAETNALTPKRRDQAGTRPGARGRHCEAQATSPTSTSMRSRR